MRTAVRRLTWASSVATALTGVVYAWMKYMMHPVDPWAAINHPLQPWVLEAHILVAPVLVFCLGMIVVDHAWKRFRAGMAEGRRSGITVAVSVAPMVLTGYLIQTVTGARTLTALAWIHGVTGVLYLGGLVLHHRWFRRTRAAR